MEQWSSSPWNYWWVRADKDFSHPGIFRNFIYSVIGMKRGLFEPWREHWVTSREGNKSRLHQGMDVDFSRHRQVSASIYRETNLDPHHHGMAITLPTMIIRINLSGRIVLTPGEYWIRNSKMNILFKYDYFVGGFQRKYLRRKLEPGWTNTGYYL